MCESFWGVVASQSHQNNPTQWIYFQFTIPFREMGGYTEDLKQSTKLAKLEWWVLVWGWALAWRWSLAQDNTGNVRTRQEMCCHSKELHREY